MAINRTFRNIVRLLRETRRIRNHRLQELLALYNAMLKDLEAAGATVRFTALDALGKPHALFAEALARFDLDLPYYPCLDCARRDAIIKVCKCGGRGWFSKRESEQYAASKYRFAGAQLSGVSGTGKTTTKELASRLKALFALEEQGFAGNADHGLSSQAIDRDTLVEGD